MRIHDPLAPSPWRSLALTFLFALPAVYSLDTAAADATCTLYVADLNRESAADWRALGYALVERPNLNTLNVIEKAALLDSSHFLLLRGDKNVMQMSLTDRRYVPGWQPISFAAPAPRAKPDQRYACAALAQRFPFYRESRRAIEDVQALEVGRKINRTRGEAMLDLERSYLVQVAAPQYERTKAKETYRELLAKVVAIKDLPEVDFFRKWRKVRQLVYGRGGYGIDYCRDFPTMTAALVDACTNCLGESYLLSALFLDAGFKAPEGMVFGSQPFHDHLRPALYEKSTNKVYDLATGGRRQMKGSLARADVLYMSLLNGHRALRTPEELAWAKLVPTVYLHQSPGCERESVGYGRALLAAADLVGVRGCGWFLPPGTKVPERASNAGKTREDFDETDEAGDGDGDPEGGTPMEEQAATQLRGVADNFAPEERAVILAATAAKKKTAQFESAFSAQDFIKKLGRPDLAPTAKMSISVPPLYVEYVADLSKMRETPFNDPDPNSAIWVLKTGVTTRAALQKNELFNKLMLNDAPLVARLKALPSALRHRAFLEYLAGLLRKPEMEANRLLSLATSDENLNVLYARSATLGEYAAVLGATQKWFTTGMPQASYSPGSVNGEKPKTIYVFGEAGEDILLTSAAFDKLAAENLPRWLAWLEDHSVELFKQIESAPNGRQTLWNTFESLSIIYERVRTANNLMQKARIDRGLERWQNGPDSYSLLETLTYRVMTHEQYFFTVAPDAVDAPATQKVAPLKLYELRVAESTKSTRPSGVQINLPEVAGVSCPDGQSGLFVSGGFYVQCGNDAASDMVGAGTVLRPTEGQIGGATRGAGVGSLVRNDARFQRGYSDAKSDGTSPTDQTQLTGRVSPTQIALQGGGRVTGAPLSPSLQDPRVEVQVSPEAWDWLLHAMPSSFMMEPRVRVLLHHLYRNKLRSTYLDLAKDVQFFMLDPVVHDIGVIILDRDATSTFTSNCLGSPPKCDLPKFLSEGKLKRMSAFGGELLGAPFFRVALRELEHPKAGFVRVIGPGATFNHDEIRKAMASSFFGRADRGSVVHAVYSDNHGDDYATFSPEFASYQKAFNFKTSIGSSDMNIPIKRDGRIIGIVSWIGGRIDARSTPAIYPVGGFVDKDPENTMLQLLDAWHVQQQQQSTQQPETSVLISVPSPSKKLKSP